MILLRAAGCGWEPDEGIRVRLRATAEAFLAAGGAVSLLEWMVLTTEEREALTEAAAALRRPEERPEEPEDRERRLLAEAVDAAAGAIPMFVAGEEGGP